MIQVNLIQDIIDKLIIYCLANDMHDLLKITKINCKMNNLIHDTVEMHEPVNLEREMLIGCFLFMIQVTLN